MKFFNINKNPNCRVLERRIPYGIIYGCIKYRGYNLYYLVRPEWVTVQDVSCVITCGDKSASINGPCPTFLRNALIYSYGLHDWISLAERGEFGALSELSAMVCFHLATARPEQRAIFEDARVNGTKTWDDLHPYELHESDFPRRRVVKMQPVRMRPDILKTSEVLEYNEHTVYAHWEGRGAASMVACSIR